MITSFRNLRLMALTAALVLVSVLSFAPEGVAQVLPGGCSTISLLPGMQYKTNAAGTSCDLVRNNYDTGAIVTFAAQGPATVTSLDQTNYDGRSLICRTNLSAIVGSPSLTVTIQGYDAASAAYYTLLAGTAIVTATTQNLIVGPFTASANAVANTVVPRIWRISAVESGSMSSVTGTIGCNVLE